MRLPRLRLGLARGFLLRRLSRQFDTLIASLDRQTTAIERIADQLAPRAPIASNREIVADTGVSHLDPVDAGLALDFIARTEAATGYTPDDDDVLIYLGDEKTTELHARLTARAQELAVADANRRALRGE